MIIVIQQDMSSWEETGMTAKHAHLISQHIITSLLILVLVGLSTTPPVSAQDVRSFNITTEAGLVAMNLNTDGYNGSFLSTPYWPSLEYPLNSNVEHLYHAGLWIGIRTYGEHHRVSTSAEDATGMAQAQDIREFEWDDGEIVIRSNDQANDNYHPEAVATWEAHYAFEDNADVAGHAPLGLRVETRALAWADPQLDDAVVLEYTIINQSDETRYDIYVGYYTDATIGNTDITDPYDPGAPIGWNFWDDLIGAYQPGEVAADPDGWLMHRHDDDGEDGYATSWAGTRLLSLDPPAEPAPPQPPVSYNAWRYAGVPQQDDIYVDDDEEMPGKYQLMSNGQFDVGVTAETDFTQASDWMSLLSTGPIPELAAGDTIRVAFAVVCAADSSSLPLNAAAIARHHANGYQVVGVPSSPPRAMVSFSPPFPNPFNPGTVLQYSLVGPQQVTISIHAVDGSLVRTLVNAMEEAGQHQVVWDGRDTAGRQVPSGHYMARLVAGGTSLAHGLTLLK